MADVSLSFAGARFEVLPCGALFWPAMGCLLVADLHLEKGSAFARRGWLLPPHDSLDTLDRLEQAVTASGARRLVALGDSFHDADGPARLLPQARARLEGLLARLDWLWVTGNHDGDSGAAVGGAAVAEIELGGIWLRHEADRSAPGPEISGHYHPKVEIRLRTGRRLSRRCLALAGDRLVLPAYGAYAGGLGIDDPAYVQALGAAPEALVPSGAGLIRLPADHRERVA